jgi:hypothetical protein
LSRSQIRGEVNNRGQMTIQAERDLLKIPYSFLVRLRYNPFYGFLETRVLEWFAISK